MLCEYQPYKQQITFSVNLHAVTQVHYILGQVSFPPNGFLHAGGSDFRLYDGSDLKTYLLMRW